MRIISGFHKGRRINVPKTFQSRPTTDFAKESLFNVLANSISFEEITVLDLFSGTGSIAFEFASRGAIKVTAVEKDFRHVAFIRKNATILRIENIDIIRSDVFSYVRKVKADFDLIFADPPYILKNITEIPDIILSSSALKQNALFILEHSGDNQFTNHPCFEETRKYGSVNFSFFRKK